MAIEFPVVTGWLHVREFFQYLLAQPTGTKSEHAAQKASQGES